ncbi:MAG: AAA family ATPase [Candidatus Zixiibacteriota bacterium]|nr:MAG: AAA family ATPase [candidate division Zixibacteria bacterium]
MTDHGTTGITLTRIVSICSGKGGVGKSILAFNLAERLASMGVRVLLIDADSNCGDLHVLANIEVSCGFREFVRGQLTLAEAVISTRYGFDMLAAGAGEVLRTDADITPVAECMAALRTQSSPYDIIIMDHSSGVSKATEVMAHASDIVLLLLVPELTSISDAFGLFKHLKHTDSGIDCRLVVNRAESAEEADYIRTKFQAITRRFIGSSPVYLGDVAEAAEIRKGVASQTAVAQIAPEAHVTQTLKTLAGRLLEACGRSTAAQTNEQLDVENEINKTTALADIRE